MTPPTATATTTRTRTTGAVVSRPIPSPVSILPAVSIIVPARQHKGKRIQRRKQFCNGERLLWLSLVLLWSLLVTVNLSLLPLDQDDTMIRDASTTTTTTARGRVSRKEELSTSKTRRDSSSTSVPIIKTKKEEEKKEEDSPNTRRTATAAATNRNTDDKTPLIRILEAANVVVSPSLLAQLPTWSQVVEVLGSSEHPDDDDDNDDDSPSPRMIGTETCQAFRDTVPLADRYVAPSGMFNSGTNLFQDLLHRNCVLHHNSSGGSRRRHQKKNQNTGVDWQVNWGKHQSPRFRFENVLHERRNNSNIFPIVLVRDPWTWFQSMCRIRYSAHWYHIVPHHCPNFIPNEVEREWFDKSRAYVRKYYDGDVWKVDNVLDKANYTLDRTIIPVRVRYKSETAYHTSLAHFWKDWYQEYYEADFPRLMIRLEDLVFFPEQVLQEVCDCVGGTLAKKPLVLAGETSKRGGEAIHGNNKTNLVGAMRMHILSNRTLGMTPADRTYATTILEDSPVRQQLGYKSP